MSVRGPADGAEQPWAGGVIRLVRCVIQPEDDPQRTADKREDCETDLLPNPRERTTTGGR
jgi:hypothetical protein